jgi:hypothetical protein
MQNVGNVYIWGSPFVMSRTDAQNGVDIINRSASFSLSDIKHEATAESQSKYIQGSDFRLI